MIVIKDANPNNTIIQVKETALDTLDLKGEGVSLGAMILYVNKRGCSASEVMLPIVVWVLPLTASGTSETIS